MALPLLAAQAGEPRGLPRARPEEVGISSERLRRVDDVVRRYIDEKKVSGAVTLVARRGRVVHYEAQGLMDVESEEPMRTDAIFRMASSTKPVTGVAILMLIEEGKVALTDPVSKFIPEFAQLKVFKGLDQSGKMILEDPIHPPTMRELMSHTAGFTYGIFGHTPVDKMYQDEHILQSESLQVMVMS